MKLKMRLSFALNQIFTHFSKFFMSVIIMTVSLVLTSFCIMGYQGLNYNYNDCNKILNNSMDKSGIINLLDNDDEIYLKYTSSYIKKLYNSEMIDAIGYCDIYNSDIFNKFLNINNQINILYMNYTLIDFCNLEFSKKEELSSDTFDNVKFQPIYLGSKYKNIPIGTVFTASDNNIYKVMGILKPNQKWIEPELVNGFNWLNGKCTVNIDNAIICLEDTFPSSSSVFFSINKNFSYDQVKQFAIDEANVYGLKIGIGTLKHSYEVTQLDNQVLTNYLNQIMVIVVFSSIIIMVCIQIVIILNEKKSFGIMYAIGFESNDIYIIILLENFTTIVLSFIINCCISLYIGRWWFTNDMETIVHEILLKSTFPYILIMSIIIYIITSIIPISILKKYTPVNLIGGEK